jgi:hypothetical protein
MSLSEIDNHKYNIFNKFYVFKLLSVFAYQCRVLYSYEYIVSQKNKKRHFLFEPSDFRLTVEIKKNFSIFITTSDLFPGILGLMSWLC